MDSNVVLVTGSTDGIGKYTALELARKGANVLLHGRSVAKTEATLEEICRKTGSNRLETYIADLSSQEQIRRLSREIHQKHEWLHVLINNAGVFMPDRQLTSDGLETTFAVNYLAPFLLTRLLLDLLREGAPSRVINISSEVHRKAVIDWNNLQGEKGYDGYAAYALSKLAVTLFTYELARRFRDVGITANCLHPGIINTKLLRTCWKDDAAEDVSKGAETPVYLATSADIADVTGKYFSDKRPSRSSPLTYNRKLQQKFWQLGERLTQAV